MEEAKQLVDSNSAKTKLPKFRMGETKDSLIIGEKASNKILEALAVVDGDLATLLLEQIGRTFAASERPLNEKCNMLLALANGVRPRDELEVMLVAQMIGAHNAAMEFTRRAVLKEQAFEAVDANTNRATKFMRAFTRQVEALTRYRGKGQQKVVVKHVHVNEGGQAIVGNVEGGGGNVKKRQ